MLPQARITSRMHPHVFGKCLTEAMSTNDYHFITRWRLEGAIEEIANILADAPSLTRWWPSVYLDVRELEPGE